MKRKLKILTITSIILGAFLIAAVGYIAIFSANFGGKYYKVNFNTYSEIYLEDIEVKENETLKNGYNPTREGYTFAGWYLDENLSIPYANNQVTSDLTLYAKWIANQYFIMFETNSGSSILPLQVAYDSTVSSITQVTTREGYIFGGWYFDKELKFEFTETKINKHLTLYARWYRDEVVINFNSDGANLIDEIKVDVNTRISELPKPTKDGYNFLGWYKEGNDQVLYNTNFTADKNYTLYAKWERITHTVNFVTFDGEPIQGVNVYKYQKVSVLPIAYKEGFTFQAWYIDEALTEIFDINTVIESNITLYAKFEKVAYKVSFDTFGGSDHQPVFISEGGSYKPNFTPTKNGYDFIGWYTDKELTTKLADSLTVSMDTVIYAKFERKSFTVNYQTNQSDIVIPTTTLKYLEEVVTTPLAKEGYTFNGWFIDASFTRPFVNGTSITSNLTLHAKWTATTYEITLINDGQTIKNVSHGEKLNFEAPEKVGYTFNGWYLDQSFTSKFDLNSLITKDYTLYAKYEAIAYKITYDTSLYTTDVSVFYNQAIPQVPNPIKTGYTFEGWLLDGEPFTMSHMPAENLIVHAKWSINRYVFSFNSLGGNTTPRTHFFEHGQEANLDEPATSKTGYKFLGWYTDLNDDSTKWDFTKVHTMESNVTLFAKWEANSHMIQYFVDNGSITTAIYKYEEKINEYKPNKAGYSLIGWYEIVNGENVSFTLTTMPDRSVNLYPVWEKNTYQIIHQNADLENITYEFEAPISSLVDPVRLGFTFNGWFIDADYTKAFNYLTMPAYDIEVYALWLVEDKTIGFESNGGSKVESIIGEAGEIVTKPNDPVRTGYEFAGWYSDIQLVTPYEFTVIPEEGIVVYAKWIPIIYQIKYVPNTFDYIEDIEIRYNDLIPTLPSLIKEGYIFAGWYLDADYTQRFTLTRMPAYDITLYAKWELVYYRIGFESEYRIPTIVATFGEAIAAPEVPVKNGYTFVGWFIDIDLQNEFIFDTMPNNNYYLFAKWQINTYEIEFDSNDGSPVEKLVLNYDQLITITAHTERTGYTFNGWYLDASLNTPFTLSNMPANNLVIYAKWNVNQYEVKFIDDNESIIRYDYMSEINYLPSNKVGYTFIGWFLDDTRLTPAPLYMGSENLVLYGKWVINSYEINFESNGGTFFDSIIEEYNKLFTPPTPTKVGYTFDGWYLDQALTNKYTSTRVLPNDVTLYAKWNIKSYRFSFSTNSDVLEDIIYEYNQVIPALKDISRTGYTFKGWFLDQAYTRPFNLTNMPDSDVRVFAKWEINSYTITFESNGGPDVSPLTQNFDTVVREPQKPIREGYTFKGWFEDQALTEPYNFLRMKAEDITLYAKWEINSYTISFVSSGNQLESVTYDFNETLLPFGLVSREGYTFTGWYLDQNYTQLFSLTNMPSRNLVLYAKFEINNYTVTFESNGGTQINELLVTFNESLTKPQDPTKAGHTFVGWFIDEALTNPYSFLRMPAHDVKLYAKWQVNSYKITFNSNVGLVIEDRVYNYNDFISVLPNLEVYGNIFLGWYTQDNEKFEVLSNSSYQITKNIILNAKWQKGIFTITFDSNGGSDVLPITQEFNSVVNEPAHPTKPNYQFAGWYKDQALTEDYYFSRMSGEDQVLYAKWIRINDLTVTYHTNNELEDIVNTYTVLDINSSLTHPVLVKEGYTFNGWYMDQGLTIPVISTLPDYDFSAYAKWTINKYTITFDLDGATGTNVISQDFNSVVNKPNDPIKQGYTFKGWYSDENYQTPYEFTTIKAENITVYALFEINQYVINFVTNEGTEVSSITLDYNALITVFTQTTKEGYTFVNWYTNEALTEVFALTNMPSNDLTLYAKFNINTYKVTYVSDLVTVPDLEVTYNSPINLQTPTKEGYTFIGWFKDQAYTQTFDVENMPAENLTVYAKFEINKYTITFDSNEGSEVQAITENFNTVILEPAKPTRLGYTFVGWFENDTLYVFNKVEARDITLVAKWNLIPTLTYLTQSTSYYLLEDDHVVLRVRVSDDDLEVVNLVFNVGINQYLVNLLPNQLNPLQTTLNGVSATYDASLQEWIITIEANTIKDVFTSQVDLALTIKDKYNHVFESVSRSYNFTVTSAPSINYVTPSGETNLGESETFTYEMKVQALDLIMVKLDTNEFGRINIFMNENDPYGSVTNKNRLNALGITLTYVVDELGIATISVSFNSEATYRLITRGELSVVASIEDSVGHTTVVTNNYIIK